MTWRRPKQLAIAFHPSEQKPLPGVGAYHVIWDTVLGSGFGKSSIVLFCLQDTAVKWNHNDHHEPTDAAATFTYEQLVGSSSIVNKSFLDGPTNFHSSASHASGSERDQGCPVINDKILPLPPKGGLELCPDRDSVLSLYKQKRKTRRYDKLIRYESRKARADTRMRIKGRFAKANHIMGS